MTQRAAAAVGGIASMFSILHGPPSPQEMEIQFMQRRQRPVSVASTSPASGDNVIHRTGATGAADRRAEAAHPEQLALLDGFPIVRAPVQGESVYLRPYRNSDRESVCRLCCDTGFLGQPVDELFCDRELFADLFTRVYLEREQNWGLVAEANGRIVAYLLGSVRPHFTLLQLSYRLRTAAKMSWRLAGGCYARHAPSRRFVRWLFTAGLQEQPRKPPGAAHLHMDVDARYRGCGVARRLWQLYERRLRAAGVERCYGAFYSHPRRRPEFAYARYGFRVYDRRPTTLFAPDLREPVEVVCVCKDI
jgi:ribosomal protein S18 acetylase RimI-like enzyme